MRMGEKYRQGKKPRAKREEFSDKSENWGGMNKDN